MLDWPAEFLIISAYATTGQSWPPDENQQADQRLASELRDRNCWLVRIVGYSPTSGHEEPSWAVALPPDVGIIIGRRYRQDAIYHVNNDILSCIECEGSEEYIDIGSFRGRLDGAPAGEAAQEGSDTGTTQVLLDQLLAESRLYRNGKDFQELLDFVVRLRNLAPFNAMLLQVQKPGLRFAASAHDWRVRFGRTLAEGARPLLILWPFGPVALVYDVVDTEGDDLPKDVASCFRASGQMNEERLTALQALLAAKSIHCYLVDAGDARAGAIRVVRRAGADKEIIRYSLHINRHHVPPTQFGTLSHELGHLFLGHLGRDPRLHVPDRRHVDHAGKELEAESVAYVVCRRNGIELISHTYLSNFVNSSTTTPAQLDVYRIMRAAGQVESVLGLAPHITLEAGRGNTGQAS